MIEYLPLLNLVLTFVILPAYKTFKQQEEILRNQQKEIDLLKEVVKELKKENDMIKDIIFNLADAETLKECITKTKKLL